MYDANVEREKELTRIRKEIIRTTREIIRLARRNQRSATAAGPRRQGGTPQAAH
jgi:hypothetical protein